MNPNDEKNQGFDSHPKISPPTQDPCEIYNRPETFVPGINCRDFQLPPEGLTPEQRQVALNQLYEYESRQQAHFLGYQTNQKLDYEDDLKQYLNFHLNNVGDPFKSGNLSSRWLTRQERSIIAGRTLTFASHSYTQFL